MQCNDVCPASMFCLLPSLDCHMYIDVLGGLVERVRESEQWRELCLIAPILAPRFDRRLPLAIYRISIMIMASRSYQLPCEFVQLSAEVFLNSYFAFWVLFWCYWAFFLFDLFPVIFYFVCVYVCFKTNYIFIELIYFLWTCMSIYETIPKKEGEKSGARGLTSPAYIWTISSIYELKF